MWKKFARKLVQKCGYELVSYNPAAVSCDFAADFDQATIETIRVVKPYTMTSPERIFALCQAVRYVVHSGILGAIVECGVWKGGSMMAAARTLLELNDQTRDLYLFDTYEGMAPPEARDVSVGNIPAAVMGAALLEEKWCYAPLDEVKHALYSVGYDQSKLHFVKGRVEETIPLQAPEAIALLRLDTDWYQSTKHELLYLFPRLTNGAVIIIDDYGFWKGCRDAVDEYLVEHRISLLLNRIDDAGRIGVVFKPMYEDRKAFVH